MPSHLVDVILLRRVDEDSACPDDKMYTIESKVWTSPMKEGHSSLTDALAMLLKTKQNVPQKQYLILCHNMSEMMNTLWQIKFDGLVIP